MTKNANATDTTTTPTATLWERREFLKTTAAAAGALVESYKVN